ncbi:MAG TPA: apolipoprotein N-acyltransferase [Candidatus Binatia bacterium]
MSTAPHDRAQLLAAGMLVAASGWLCAQSFPGGSSPSLAFVALVPFLVCARLAPGARAATLFGALWMLLFAWGINDWFAPAVSRYFEKPWSFGFAGFLAVTLLTAAPATVLFARFLRCIGPRPRVLAPFLVAAAWTAGELLRSRVLGDPWGLLGYSQASRPVWLQVADFSGIYGVGFVVAATNAALAELLLLGAAQPRASRASLFVAAPALVVPLLAFVYGSVQLDESPAAAADRRELVVVQGNLDFRQQWRLTSHVANLQRYRDLTQSALADERADLVVWPENAVTFFLDREEALRKSLAGMLGASHAMLLAGGPRVQSLAPQEFRNSAFLLGQDASIVSYYDKQRLLPFGEYRPMHALAFEQSDPGPVREFSPGPPEASLLDAAGLPVGVVICNEALFPDPARERVRAGAQLLVALTNDSWVGQWKYAEQAFEQSVVRAVEERRYLVRASTSGPSAVVDDAGQVLARTRDDSEEVLRHPIQARRELSIYARVGDLFAWCCAAIVAAAWTRLRATVRRLP